MSQRSPGSQQTPLSQQNALKQAAVVIRRLEDRLAVLEQSEQARNEPIAIVGIGCRFPGGADSPEAYWELLDKGRDAVQSLEKRWAVVGAHPTDNGPRWAGLLTDPADNFDAAFFGISPREARSLDPQQRLLLEVTWEALEGAGIPPRSLEGSRTGVFVGVVTNDYLRTVERDDEQDPYTMTGNMLSVAAGRISYTLGFRGPCFVLQTACSSSLVAAHVACRSLRARECDMALAGGVNMILGPEAFGPMVRLQALSPDGRCATFDASANGYVRGEGCGVVVLKRLSDAQRDGDRIWALVRGSAINQDGRSTGLTAPNVLAQQAVLRDALRDARVEAKAIGYVETHGTGTSLGDPIEVDALREVVGPARSDGTRCVLGAVKTNIGHLEGAAGVASLIKAALLLHHERIPRNLNFRTLNPRIRLEGTALALATEPVPWPRTDRPRLAGVSAFGLSGTNAHLVLEEAPVVEPAPEAPNRSAELLVLSAKSPAALDAKAAQLRDHLDAHPELSLGDVAFSLATTRSPLEHRLAVAAASREALQAALVNAAAGQTPAGAVRGRVSTGGTPKVVFVFPGQGSQWLGMGRQLLAEEPVFRTVMQACDRAIQAEVGWSVLTELTINESASKLGLIDVVQPVLFAMEVALSALWRSWGVEPDAVVGHSMGEVAAAHVAGALPLADAVAIICRRSRLLRRISGRGEMAVVELSLAQAAAALAGYEDRLSVAVSNSPRSTVLSGDPTALGEVLASLEAKGVFCRRVKVDVASHSPQVDPLRPDLTAALSDLRPLDSAVPMRSTVTGAFLAGSELGAGYWVDNLRQPVRFADAVQALLESGHGLFVEMSPHPILTTSVEEIRRAAGREGAVLASLRRGQDERPALLEALGALWVQGYPVAWEQQFPAGGRRVPLPTYPWQREHYWIEAAARPAALQLIPAGAAKGSHPLLGVPFEVAVLPDTRLWASALSAAAHPWLSDHRVYDTAVLPGAAFVELALAAGAETFRGTSFEVREVELERVLIVPTEGSVPLQIALTREGAAGTVQVQSQEDGVWRRNARAVLRLVDEAERGARRGEAPEVVQTRCHSVIRDDELYERLAGRGLKYGPAFRGVEQIWLGEDEALGRVRLPEAAGAEGWGLHPALLDACFHVSAGLFRADTNDAAVVLSIERVRVRRRPDAPVWVHARTRRDGDSGPNVLAADLVLLDDQGQVLAEVDGLRIKQVSPAVIPGRDPVADWLFTLGWKRLSPPAPGDAETRAGAPWLLLVDRSGTGAGLAALLEGRGDRCVVVEQGPSFARLGPDRYQADPADVESMQAVLRAAFAGGAACRGAVHLWSLDAAPLSATTPESLEADLERGSLSALHLAQALLRQGWRDVPRLWLVTRGAQAVGGETSLSVSQAPLWGLGRALSMEHPELGCVRMDLPLTSTANDARAVLEELGATDGEDQVALRSEGRFGARLVRLSAPPSPEPVVLRDDASYLVTGGLGGLGLSVAAWMVARGARHLVLVGRSGASEAARAAIAALEAQGAEVDVVRADVSRHDEVAALLDGIAQRLPPLRGIVHSAGVLEDATVLTLDAARFRAVMGPKVHGAASLHTLTAGMPLDFFVLYASGAGLLGSPGQANHSAANVFLDALAHHRRAQGLTALSLDWGAFSEVGSAVAQANRGARFAARGMESLTPDEGLSALERLWSGSVAQAGVLKFDARRWVEFYPAAANWPLWEDLRREADRQRPVEAAPNRLRDELQQAEPRARAARLERHLAEVLGQVLRLDPRQIDRQAAFSTYGMDSLMSLEVRNRLEVDLGERLSATLLFTYPTLLALTQHLLERLAASDAPPAPKTESGAQAQLASEVAAMSEEDAMAALQAEFDVRLPEEVHGV